MIREAEYDVAFVGDLWEWDQHKLSEWIQREIGTTAVDHLQMHNSTLY